MFVSLVLVSAFTATMASIFTAERLAGVSIRGIEDLRELKVGAVEYSSGANFLEENHIPFTKLAFSELLNSLNHNKVEAIVYDEPILRYTVRNKPQFTVLSLPLDTELYAFALREGSLIVNSSQGGGSKDTWVLTSSPGRDAEADGASAFPPQAVRGAEPDRGPHQDQQQ